MSPEFFKACFTNCRPGVKYIILSTKVNSDLIYIYCIVSYGRHRFSRCLISFALVYSQGEEANIAVKRDE